LVTKDDGVQNFIITWHTKVVMWLLSHHQNNVTYSTDLFILLYFTGEVWGKVQY